VTGEERDIAASRKKRGGAVGEEEEAVLSA
jgi:hypothetical protein